MRSGLANAQETNEEQTADVIEEIVAVESAIGREIDWHGASSRIHRAIFGSPG